MHTFRAFLTALAFVLTAAAAHAAELVMVTQKGCLYCRQWEAQVGPEYPLTAEGRAAPLRRIDLHTPRPEDLSFAGPLRITPTFVLMIEGQEAARIEGYPGEDFFWGMLGRMLETHDVTMGEQG